MIREYRQGKGFVVRSMFRDIEADCYVMVDADDTYRVRDALRLAEYVHSGQADMAIGDRLSTTYFAENKRRFHGLGNQVVRLLVNRLFHSDIRDIMTGSRAFSARRSWPTSNATLPGNAFRSLKRICVKPCANWKRQPLN